MDLTLARRITRRTAILAALAFTASLPGSAASRRPPGRPDKVLGSYKLEFRGALVGQGNAAVTPRAVNLNAHLQDESGNRIHLVATNLFFEDGRFSGTGRAEGSNVIVSGRVEPPDATLRNARLVCTFTLSTGRHGRGVGSRQQ